MDIGLNNEFIHSEMAFSNSRSLCQMEFKDNLETCFFIPPLFVNRPLLEPPQHSSFTDVCHQIKRNHFKIIQNPWPSGPLITQTFTGPAVQNIVSLTKLLAEDLLSLTVGKKSTVIIFFCRKIVRNFCTFFGKNL